MPHSECCCIKHTYIISVYISTQPCSQQSVSFLLLVIGAQHGHQSYSIPLLLLARKEFCVLQHAFHELCTHTQTNTYARTPERGNTLAMDYLLATLPTQKTPCVCRVRSRSCAKRKWGHDDECSSCCCSFTMIFVLACWSSFLVIFISGSGREQYSVG